MPYATADDLTTRFTESELIQLTDRAQVGEIDTDVLTAAISDATSEIDDYLSKRYPLPITDLTALARLVRICCDIARYVLYDDHATEHVIRRYGEAVSYLKAVAAGDLDLYPVSTATGVDDVEFTSQTTVFSSKELDGF